MDWIRFARAVAIVALIAALTVGFVVFVETHRDLSPYLFAAMMLTPLLAAAVSYVYKMLDPRWK